MLQACIPSNTYSVSGHSETKKLQDMLPQIINQLGAENVDQLRDIAQGMEQKEPKKEASKDEEIPETETFE